MNTDWRAFEPFGSFFRLQNGVLMAAPMNLDGTRDADSEYEVDFQRIDAEDAAKLLKLKDSLA